MNFINDEFKNKKKSKIFIYNKFKRSLGEILTNRANSSPNKKINKIPKLGFCFLPFSQFNVTVNGVVSHCCADFYFSNEMGNIQYQKLIDIWNGDKFVKIRNNLKNHSRDEETMCAGCDTFGVYKPKNIFKRIFDRSGKTTRYFIGRTHVGKKAIYVTARDVARHIKVIGKTGSGKTESVLKPIALQNLYMDHPTIFVDGKGDQDLIGVFNDRFNDEKEVRQFFNFNTIDVVEEDGTALDILSTSNTFNPSTHSPNKFSPCPMVASV